MVRGIAPLLSVFDYATAIKMVYWRTGLWKLVQLRRKLAPQRDWVLLVLNGSELMLNTSVR